MLAAAFALVDSGAPMLLALAAAALGGLGGAASLIVHELGHVRAARRLTGVEPVRISLQWFGAGTRFEGAYRSGRDQARVAIAGPAASLAFAVPLAASALLPSPRTVQLAIFGLALLNVAIAAVSLVPVYPLDGHKLALGVLWRVSGSERRATTIVSRAGKGGLALEGIGCAVLAIERPLFAALAVTLAAVLYVQRYLTRRGGYQNRSKALSLQHERRMDRPETGPLPPSPASLRT
jgi:Zn-dependent protease